jgi:hypothetical protein
VEKLQKPTSNIQKINNKQTSRTQVLKGVRAPFWRERKNLSLERQKA